MAVLRPAYLVLCLAVSVRAVTMEHSGPKVVSADAFMRSLHLHRHQEAPHRSSSQYQAVRPGWRGPGLRGEEREPSERGELGEAGPSPVKAAPVNPTPEKLTRDLSRLRQLSKPSAKEQREMDLASERKHFPKTEEQIAQIQLNLKHSKEQVAAVSKLSQVAGKKYAAKQAEMRKVQDHQEFALMTDPHAEKAEIDADKSLAELHVVTKGYTHQVKAEEAEVGKLGEALEQKMREREANLKAVKLFHKFRTEYEENMTGRVAAMSAEFHKKALAAADALAHAKFEKFKTAFLQKEATATSQRLKDMKARRLARAKRRAEEQAEMDAKAKVEARQMYKSYVERFHDMEQQEASLEVESRLGESGSDDEASTD